MHRDVLICVRTYVRLLHGEMFESSTVSKRKGASVRLGIGRRRYKRHVVINVFRVLQLLLDIEFYYTTFVHSGQSSQLTVQFTTKTASVQRIQM